MARNRKQAPEAKNDAAKNVVIAFIDLLGTSYYSRTDKSRYHENLGDFHAALEAVAPVLDGVGRVYLFSDCAYVESSDARKLILYLKAIRAFLLPYRIYLQGAVDVGQLNPNEIRSGVVQGTFFGPDVAAVYAVQDALKGAGVRITSRALAENEEIGADCVTSCHLPVSTATIPECFYDIRYEIGDVDRLLVENVLVDCMRAKAVNRSSGAYYISPLISMIQSVPWQTDIDTDLSHDRPGAWQLFDLIIRQDFIKHLGDLRGAALVVYSMLNQAYDHLERNSICNEICEYIARYPKALLERIDSIPPAILSYTNRRKFLEAAVVWSRKAEKQASTDRIVGSKQSVSKVTRLASEPEG